MLNHHLLPQFILVCTDGVWEFISSQEAVDIISGYDESETTKAAEALAQEAWRRWLHEEGNVVDDITVILVHLHHTCPQPKNSGSAEQSAGNNIVEDTHTTRTFDELLPGGEPNDQTAALLENEEGVPASPTEE